MFPVSFWSKLIQPSASGIVAFSQGCDGHTHHELWLSSAMPAASLKVSKFVSKRWGQARLGWPGYGRGAEPGETPRLYAVLLLTW